MSNLFNSPKVVTDWAGNEIKEGHEICFIRIKTGGVFSNFGIIVPQDNNTFSIYTSKVEEKNEDCWEVGSNVYKVFKGEGGNLFYTEGGDDFSVTCPISNLLYVTDNRFVIAIKGISDTKNEKFISLIK